MKNAERFKSIENDSYRQVITNIFFRARRAYVERIREFINKHLVRQSRSVLHRVKNDFPLSCVFIFTFGCFFGSEQFN